MPIAETVVTGYTPDTGIPETDEGLQNGFECRLSDIIVRNDDQTLRGARVDLDTDGAAFRTLRDKVANNGQTMPILVFKDPELPDDPETGFQPKVLKNGRQRLEIARLEGWEFIWALEVPYVADEELMLAQLDDNTHVPMTNTDYLKAMQFFEEKFAEEYDRLPTRAEIAKKLRVAPGFIDRIRKLNRLPAAWVQKFVDTGKVNVAVASEIAKVVGSVQPKELEMLLELASEGGTRDQVRDRAKGYRSMFNTERQRLRRLGQLPPEPKLRPKKDVERMLLQAESKAKHSIAVSQEVDPETGQIVEIETVDPYWQGRIDALKEALQVDDATLEAKAKADKAKADKAAAARAKAKAEADKAKADAEAAAKAEAADTTE